MIIAAILIGLGVVIGVNYQTNVNNWEKQGYYQCDTHPTGWCEKKK